MVETKPQKNINEMNHEWKEPPKQEPGKLDNNNYFLKMDKKRVNEKLNKELMAKFAITNKKLEDQRKA